jgi:cytidyltransferase-like protein
MRTVIVTGSFDDLRSRHTRFLEEAAKFGDVHVLLWSNDTIRALDGSDPKFPQEERRYLLQAIRYTHQVTLVTGANDPDTIPEFETVRPDIWIVDAASDTEQKKAFCASHGLEYHVLRPENLTGFPPLQNEQRTETGELPRKKVVVTGCFDWLHSGHVRFFEEVSGLGDLYVAVGNDTNVRLLKGEGHPMIYQDERRYMVQSIRYVTQALITSGSGWMDAAPEIAAIKPDIYAVNEDGDQPEKRAFCEEHGLEYIVLKRTPKEGLPRRESTKLRGF